MEIYNQSIDIETMDGDVLVRHLPQPISDQPHLKSLAEVEVPHHVKPFAPPTEMSHREFADDEFWHRIPAFSKVQREEFIDWSFQNKNTVTRFPALKELLSDLVDPEFLNDVERGLEVSPMMLRLSPYILSLIDWSDPYNDPLRIQFIPTASTKEPDHPLLKLDSLGEKKDSPTSGLVHRYPGKVLFLTLDICPVYCRFCTRSYAIGPDTDTVKKNSYNLQTQRWEKAFAYIASRPEIEDVVISGGDTYMLSPKKLRQVGEVLLDIPHVRRIRFATKGPAVMPMKILTHHEWRDTLVDLVRIGRDRCKEVCLHTHFNTTNEITDITREAMDVLFREGVKVRNQSVLIRGVNDDADHMISLVRQLSFMNVQPYYVYQHDMVKGAEELRTSVCQTQEIERHVRGSIAGFNTPVFVNDVPGGGGKRDLHSFDYYDPMTGVSVYRSPSVKPDAAYMYFDPITQLPNEGKMRWNTPGERDNIIREALEAADLEEANWIK